MTELFDLLNISPGDISQARRDAVSHMRQILDRSVQRTLFDSGAKELLPLSWSSIFLDAARQAFREEPSAGNVTIIFANAVLSVVGNGQVLSEETKAMLRDLCDSVKERPLPTLYWAEFTEDHLDDPQVLRYVLSGCKHNKKLLNKRIHDISTKYCGRILPSGKSRVTVFGYSETIISVLRSLVSSGRNLRILTPRQLLPNKKQSDGELLRDRLDKEHIPVEVEDNAEALQRLEQGESDLLLMGCKVMGATKEGNLEIVNSTGALKFVIAAQNANIPTGVISGAYKVWPVETYSKHRTKIEQETEGVAPLSSIVPANLVTWILTEHGIVDPANFREVYVLWFKYSGLPLGSVATPNSLEGKEFKHWQTQIERILKDMERKEMLRVREGKRRIDDIGRMAERFSELLGLLEPGEHVRIVTGQADRRFYEQVEDQLRDVHNSKGVKVSIIAGPLLSVDDKDESPLFRLTQQGIAELYFSSFRQRYHYRILGSKLVQVESYHSPLQQERQISEFSDRYTVAKYIADFDNICENFSSRFSGQEKEGFILLRDNAFTKLDWTIEHDFLNRQEVYENMRSRLDK